jgi:environmental stress-induced protein Ves
MIRDPLLIARRDWTTVPWRNGAGRSDSILNRPDLGLNRTPLEEAVPFSSYPGIDRLLIVLAGTLAMTIDGRSVAVAERGHCRFPGEAAVTAFPAGGCLVFNVLATRDRWEIGPVDMVTGAQTFARSPLRITHVASGTCSALPFAALREAETLLTGEALELIPRHGWVATCELRPAG